MYCIYNQLHASVEHDCSKDIHSNGTNWYLEYVFKIHLVDHVLAVAAAFRNVVNHSQPQNTAGAVY
jgi:hypothetical protein